jgi:hypothetical protein
MLEHARKRLGKRARKGFRGYPLATIALYGPDDTRATKLTVGTVPAENAEVRTFDAGSPKASISVTMAPLRRKSWTASFIGFFHGAVQPHLDQVQHAPINDPTRHRL